MIKAAGRRTDGAPLIVLGLSAGNVDNLRSNRPMLIHLEELGLSGDVIILYGDTEEDIRDDLAAIGAVPRK